MNESQSLTTILLNAGITLAMLGAIGFGLYKVTRTRTGLWVLLLVGVLGLGCWAYLGFPKPTF